ncbi:MAG TPA: PilZ domain-containing protein [Nitrospira sp.]|nr:PilZ domain-containing protein [Nitrospira sp.]
MENRKNKRFPVRFRSSFTSLNVVGGEGTLMDLSIRGCRIESRTEVRPGTSLELKVQASEDEPPLMIQEAIVRWSRAQQFGLEFITLAPEEWARLQHSVTQLELQPYQEKPSDTEAA